jgi:hypothetical protein
VGFFRQFFWVLLGGVLWAGFLLHTLAKNHLVARPIGTGTGRDYIDDNKIPVEDTLLSSGPAPIFLAARFFFSFSGSISAVTVSGTLLRS